MTPDTFMLLARYNAYVNTEMNKHISMLTKDEWEREFDGFYRSVKDLCNHLYIVDFAWLKRFALLRHFMYLEKPLFKQEFSFKNFSFDSIKEYLDKRIELDGVVTSFIDEVSQEDLGNSLKYKSWSGEPQDRNFAGVLLHMFNHQTHHRGMISLYLEFLGKENDFSNLVKLA
jgi:uncharacterized damage-inducible protein DinB